jgi:hypothetical protein
MLKLYNTIKGYKIHKYLFLIEKGNKTVPGKVATTRTEDGHKQDT